MMRSCKGNTNKEDDRSQPVISKDEGDDEERHSEKDCHSSDQMNEVLDLPSNRRLACVQTRGEMCNSAHNLKYALTVFTNIVECPVESAL